MSTDKSRDEAEYTTVDSAMCDDCGGRPVWRWATTNYCKRCFRKGGDETGVVIDIDHLVTLVGLELATKVVECGEPARVTFMDEDEVVVPTPCNCTGEFTTKNLGRTWKCMACGKEYQAKEEVDR